MPGPSLRPPRPLVAAIALLLAVAVVPAHAEEPAPIEDYSGYDGQKTCHPTPRKGTRLLADHLLSTYGGGGGATGRACGGGASEHKDGRAIDWTLNAARRADRKTARKFLKHVFATDADGNPHALARRMGIMYIIWNDTMYAAWDAFEPEPYLSSSCRKKRTCSRTLRHRDHVHISLTMKGAKAKTSWYQLD